MSNFSSDTSVSQSNSVVKSLAVGKRLEVGYSSLEKSQIQRHTPTVLEARRVAMLETALRYAALGLPVFPVHAPIFDMDGHCIGCSCEDYRHDEKCSPRYRLDADERCGTPGKCPAFVNFVTGATTNETTIREWFAKPEKQFHPLAGGYFHFIPNLAVRCDNLIIVDHDLYDPDYDKDFGDDLIHMGGNAPIQRAKGLHQWFLRPDNVTGGSGALKKYGIDIKAGAADYVCVEPSMHWSGKQYEWDENFSLLDMKPAPLPQQILAMLPTGKAPVAPVVFGEAVDCPKIEKLRLKPEIVELLNHGHEAADRSAADSRVICSLIRHKLSDEEILAVFQRYPIGVSGKFSESGEGYLARSVASAREYLAEQDAQQEDEEIVTPPADLATLTVQIEERKADQDKLREFAVDSVPQVATLKAVDREKFIMALEKAGAGARWVRDFRGVIRGYEKEQKKGDEEDEGFKTIDYIMGLSALGYNLRQNLLDDCIQNGDDLLDDFSDAIILNQMNDEGFHNDTRIRRAALEMAHRGKFHPLQEYLEGLTWDGQDHIGALAGKITDSHEPITYADGSKRTVTHAFLRRFLTGMIAKVYERTQNAVLVFTGGQGLGKSSLVRWLAGATGGIYHRETRLEVESNDHLRSLARTWLWELGELSGITRKADVNALKNTLSQETTTFRVPYAKYEVTKRTLTSFIGTVNPDGVGFLRDMTGNRRFACIDVTGIDWTYNNLDVTQIHAQAYHLYKSGEPWLLSPEEVAVRDENNAAHEMERLIDDVMDTLFVVTDNNEHMINPIDIAMAVHKAGYDSNLKICSMDAATWLKRQGLAKRGKPSTWRGLRLRKTNDTATNPDAGTESAKIVAPKPAQIVVSEPEQAEIEL